MNTNFISVMSLIISLLTPLAIYFAVTNWSDMRICFSSARKRHLTRVTTSNNWGNRQPWTPTRNFYISNIPTFSLNRPNSNSLLLTSKWNISKFRNRNIEFNKVFQSNVGFVIAAMNKGPLHLLTRGQLELVWKSLMWNNSEKEIASFASTWTSNAKSTFFVCTWT